MGLTLPAVDSTRSCRVVYLDIKGLLRTLRVRGTRPEARVHPALLLAARVQLRDGLRDGVAVKRLEEQAKVSPRDTRKRIEDLSSHFLGLNEKRTMSPLLAYTDGGS